jgi:hypothetical protein
VSSAVVAEGLVAEVADDLVVEEAVGVVVVMVTVQLETLLLVTPA